MSMSQDSLQRLSTLPWFLVSAPDTKDNDLGRDELFDVVENAVRHNPLTVIEAPSGFGKTTTLALWVKRRRDPTAWMSLGRDVGDTVQLLSYLMGSLIHLYPDSVPLESLTVQLHDGIGNLEDTIASLIDAVPDTQTTVVIDEAQKSSREALTDLIVPLARYSRGRLRFVLSGTSSLSTWLAKELAKGHAHRLPSTDLPFTPEEVRELVSMRGSDPANAEQLWSETAGWPVAIQLLLQPNTETRAPIDFRAHINPSVLTDYIDSEILAVLRPELRQFILDAVVCELLSPSLVRQIVKNPRAGSLLEECRVLGLFLDRFLLDGEDTLYRWHGIFAQSCREIAERNDPERFREVHRRAAEWMAKHYPAEAIHHAIATGDPDFTLRMFEEVWLQMVTGGHLTILETRCLDLPRDIAGTAPILYIRAACRDMAGDPESALVLINKADALSEDLAEERAESATITRAFATLLIVSGYEELESALENVEELLSNARLSQSQHIHGTFLAGWTRIRLRSKPQLAIKLLASAAESAQRAGFKTIARRASTTSALALAFAGHLKSAKQILGGLVTDEKTQGFDPFDGTMNYWSSLFISYWQGDMNAVMDDARILDRAGGQASSNAGMGRIYFACAAALDGRGSLDEASRLLEKVSDDVEHGVPWPAYKAISVTSLHWARGDRTAAVEALDKLGHHSGITTTLAMAADLWRRLGYPEQALRVISKIEPQLLVSYTIASIRFTEAVIAWDHGNSNRAHQLLESCLSAAVPESVCAPFLRLDDSARDLLKDHLNRGTPHAQFVAERLSEDSRVTSRPDSAPESLSAREAEVFNYLATTMTATEIADALFVSPATVRTHQRSIYRKLGVKSRREAVRAGLRDGT